MLPKLEGTPHLPPPADPMQHYSVIVGAHTFNLKDLNPKLRALNVLDPKP